MIQPLIDVQQLIMISLLYFILVVTAVTSLPAQQPGFSNRVGDTVDPAEQEYFRLFPFNGLFEQASLTGSINSELYVTIQRTLNGIRNDTAFVLGPSTATALFTYIENYEQLWSSDSSHIDWNELTLLVRPSRPYNTEPVDIWITTLDGQEIEGEVVLANDTLLIIAPGSIGNDWLNIESHVELVAPANIHKASIKRDFLRAALGDLDFVLNGSSELYRTRLLPSLDGATLFSNDLLSPELSRLLHNPNSAIPALRHSAQLTVNDRHERAWSGFVSIAVSIVSPSSTVGFFSNLEPEENGLKSAYGKFLWSAGLSYEVADGWLIGGMYTRRPAVKSNLTEGGDFEQPSNHELSAIVMTLLLQSTEPSSTPTVFGLVRRTEFGVGVGVSSAFVNVESYLSSPLIADSSLHQSMATTLIGFTGVASWNFYLHEMVSVGLMGRISVFPKVDISDKRIQHTSGNSFLFKMHDPYTISLHPIDIHAGVQFHF
jgi:hypothetical protein